MFVIGGTIHDHPGAGHLIAVRRRWPAGPEDGGLRMPFQSSPAGAMPFSLSCSRSWLGLGVGVGVGIGLGLGLGLGLK